MTIYLLVNEDRHIDIDIYPFSTYELALEAGESFMEENDYEDISEPDEYNSEYLLWYQRYNNEGDCIYIIERELDAVE